MKNEASVCTTFKNSLIAAGFKGYKIPDPSGDYGKTIKRPFDIIGSWANNLLLVEAKFESSLKSFDLQRIEDHQIEELLVKYPSYSSLEYYAAASLANRGQMVDFFDRFQHNNYLRFIKFKPN